MLFLSFALKRERLKNIIKFAPFEVYASRIFHTHLNIPIQILHNVAPIELHRLVIYDFADLEPPCNAFHEFPHMLMCISKN